MIIFWDVETTGLISYKKELNDPSQPRVISIGAILVNDAQEIVEQMNTLIYHPEPEIPDFITKINGITQSACEEGGIEARKAIEQFNDMKERSHTRVAHNLVFDKSMMAREELALGMEHYGYNGESFCTMQMCRTLGLKGNLAAMYQSLFGRDFTGVHTAMGDVLACKDIFYKVRAA